MPPISPATARRILPQTPGQPTLKHRLYKDSPLIWFWGLPWSKPASSFGPTLPGLFQSQGLTIAHNQPYAGGHITEAFGRKVPTFQLEVCRSLYVGTEKSAHAKALERLFLEYCQSLPLTPDDLIPALSMAAE